MSVPANNCTIYVGPTNYQLAIDQRADLTISWQPPVQRGDITRLIETQPAAAIAIVDGVFHHFPAVGHQEIRRALAMGWQVWGLSSMGAIRAYEMRSLGMRGFGRVYQHFVDAGARGCDFADDEVALLHGMAPDYRPISEPLVHLRVALPALVATDAINQQQMQLIIDNLANRWFGDRTLALVRQLLMPYQDRENTAIIQNWFEQFSQYRIKQHDLINFIQTKPWLIEQAINQV